jgi:response regulator receiver domain-containing protein
MCSIRYRSYEVLTLITKANRAPVRKASSGQFPPARASKRDCNIDILRKGNVQASRIWSAPAPVVVISADAGDTFLPVVILTADTNEETKRRALEAGATDFLLKPFDHVEVALRIRNLLKSRRAHQLLDNQRAALEDAVRDRTAELRATVAQLQKTN